MTLLQRTWFSEQSTTVLDSAFTRDSLASSALPHFKPSLVPCCPLTVLLNHLRTVRRERSRFKVRGQGSKIIASPRPAHPSAPETTNKLSLANSATHLASPADAPIHRTFPKLLAPETTQRSTTCGCLMDMRPVFWNTMTLCVCSWCYQRVRPDNFRCLFCLKWTNCIVGGSSRTGEGLGAMSVVGSVLGSLSFMYFDE